MNILETLKKLVNAHGVSGEEGEICAVIRTLAAPFADECTVDTMGNLIVRKKGSGPKVMFAAHMDSIGMIVTHIDEDGFLRFGKVGGLSAPAVYQMPVRFKNGVCGAVAVNEDLEEKSFKLDDLYLDIGAKDCEAAKKMVAVGDTAAYLGTTFQVGNRIVSPYLDNRVGCLVLLMALERLQRGNNDLYFVFTTQEEVGLRGSQTAAYAIDPDYGVAVDVTGTDDVPEAVHGGSSELGGGAAIKVMDSSVICHPQMIQHLKALAEECGIPVQNDVLKAGGTDAGSIHKTRMGVMTGGVSIPCRYIHSPTEMVEIADIEACVNLVTALAEKELPSI